MIPRQWRVHCRGGQAVSTDRRVAVSLSPLAPDYSRTALSLAMATAWRRSPGTRSTYAGSWVPPSHRIIPQYNTHHDFHFSAPLFKIRYDTIRHNDIYVRPKANTKRLMKKLKIKTKMLRRNGPVIKPWSQSWGRKGDYGGKDLWKKVGLWAGSERERELWMVVWEGWADIMRSMFHKQPTETCYRWRRGCRHCRHVAFVNCLLEKLDDDDEHLVGWSLTSLFSTNMAITETKGQGWRVILLPSEGRLAIY